MNVRKNIICLVSIIVTASTWLGCSSKPVEQSAPVANGTATSAPSNSSDKVLQNSKDQHVYYVFGGQKHYVPSAATLEAIGLTKQVTSATDTEIDRIPTAAQLPLLTSNVIQKASGEVYVFDNGKRRHVPDAKTLQSMHITEKQIQGVPNSVADAFPLGKPLPSVK